MAAPKPADPNSKSTSPGDPRAIDPILRRPDVRALLGISNSTLHAWVKAGRFPAPLELGPRVRGWRRSVVEAFLTNCPTTADPD